MLNIYHVPNGHDVAGFAATPLEAFEELAQEIRRGGRLGNGEPVTTKNCRFVIAPIEED